MSANTVGWPTALLVFVSLLSVGCSLGGRSFGQYEESLSVDLRANDSKLFVYQLSLPEDRRRPLVEVYTGSRDRAQRGRSQNRREMLDEGDYRALKRDAKRAVNLTGYCREGFLELDRRLSRAVLWLRGECKESASAEDRERFADRDTLPIPEPEE